jgi:ribulose kinase
MRIRASIMNRELYIPDEKEINVLGAALFGGVGAELFNDYKNAIDNIKITYEKVIEPDPKLVKIYKDIYGLE